MRLHAADDAPPRAAHNASLLGSLRHFCAAFYHANSNEGGVRLCLRRHEPGLEEEPAARRCGKSQAGAHRVGCVWLQAGFHVVAGWTACGCRLDCTQSQT